ncbi:MerR family transcriptional regulator [Vallitalea okinawensis]|uniref:MerR family transcriptional regulator n=1 Tax=Vallitalea okinawensis TaxID=2078660 RepID=UPI000CFAE707|nr:MerR family transcriptional regulator [Vallitalea okinawensis]
MNSVQKISDVAKKFDITSRTLRYYEEIGLIESIRVGEAGYRSYDDEAIHRLQQIILLRKLQLPIKDIQKIFSSQEMSDLINVFEKQLEKINEDVHALSVLGWYIKEFLTLLREKGYTRANGLGLLIEKSQELETKQMDKSDKVMIAESLKVDYMEELNMANDNISKIEDVRLIHVKPMRVAWYQVEKSSTPEDEAWDEMIKWVKEQGLDQLFTTRYFGFNNPCPEEGDTEYGYEVWATVDENVKASGKIKIKTFEGGIYAVSNTRGVTGDMIPSVWKNLHEWLTESKYSQGDHQWLEEHLTSIPSKQEERFFSHIDIYYPIKEQ